MTWADLPGRFVYCGMPCLSCGGRMVLNGPAIVDDQHMTAFKEGSATLLDYACTRCHEHWGFYGARDPESPSYDELIEGVTA